MVVYGCFARSFRHVLPQRRYFSEFGPPLFYQNKQLELYASKEAKRLTLRQLVFYGRSMNAERLINNANYVRTELPVRIAHRIRDLQALPYVVVTQEGLAKVYEMYWSAFEQFRKYPPITTLEENEAYCIFLTKLLNEHGTVIPNLSLGLSLSSPYLPPDQLDSFMRRMLISRISRRVLAEHHIALSELHMGKRIASEDPEDSHVGIIFTGLNVRRSIEKCAWLLQDRMKNPVEDSSDTGEVEVIVNGHVDTKFRYIREHLEYIIFELLKNAIHATKLAHKSDSRLSPIQVTISSGSNDVSIRISDQGGGLCASNSKIASPSDLFSFSHVRNAARMEGSRLGALRTASESDRGIKATVGEQISDSEVELGSGARPRIGIGLPMSNIFAPYFGGSLELVSLDGWGTDVYVRLPKLGTNLEGIEV